MAGVLHMEILHTVYVVFGFASRTCAYGTYDRSTIVEQFFSILVRFMTYEFLTVIEKIRLKCSHFVKTSVVRNNN